MFSDIFLIKYPKDSKFELFDAILLGQDRLKFIISG